jgi:biotin carboxylase
LNVLLLSPHFPPPFRDFARALRERGVRVLAIGDAPREALHPALRADLAEYAFVPDLHREGDVFGAAQGLVARHGGISAIESHNEHWLGLEARLREAFDVPGPRPTEVAVWQSKTAMGERFAAAGLHPPRSRPVAEAHEVRAFAAEHGFPILVKPDVGVGAGGVHEVRDAAQLEALLAEPLGAAVVQEFVEGALVTFDGLVDGSGTPVFTASFRYAAGVMEFLRDRLDVVYHARRATPPHVAEVGLRALGAFGLRSRFFHIELFELPDGRVRPLEINVRPPGGWSLDLMNFAADVDLYAAWAAVVAGDAVAPISEPHRYFAAHVGRREERRYRRSTAELTAALGPALMACPTVPEAIGKAMGDPIFLVRHEDEAALLDRVALILEPG